MVFFTLITKLCPPFPVDAVFARISWRIVITVTTCCSMSPSCSQQHTPLRLSVNAVFFGVSQKCPSTSQHRYSCYLHWVRSAGIIAVIKGIRLTPLHYSRLEGRLKLLFYLNIGRINLNWLLMLQQRKIGWMWSMQRPQSASWRDSPTSFEPTFCVTPWWSFAYSFYRSGAGAVSYK